MTASKNKTHNPNNIQQNNTDNSKTKNKQDKRVQTNKKRKANIF